MFIDGLGDAFTSGFGTEVLRGEVFGEVHLDVTCLEVVSVHSNLSRQDGARGIDNPSGLPFATPEGGELVVNAADLNLEKSFGVEVDVASGLSGGEFVLDVLVHAGLDIVPNTRVNKTKGHLLVVHPGLVELGRVLVILIFTHGDGGDVEGIEHELDISLAVVVDDKVFTVLLSLAEVDHGLATVGEVYLDVMAL